MNFNWKNRSILLGGAAAVRQGLLPLLLSNSMKECQFLLSETDVEGGLELPVVEVQHRCLKMTVPNLYQEKMIGNRPISGARCFSFSV